MIQIKDLKKQFGDKIAANIPELTIEEGSLIGLVGNNGAGKTTLFRLILDLLKADSGYVLNRGLDVSKSEYWKTYTGSFLDNRFLIDFLTPEEYFYFVGKTYNMTKEMVDERLAMFSRFMNDEILGQKKYIRNFSSGNKQKIGIMAAMMIRPQLLILDEPFNFLDPSSQLEIRDMIQKMNKEENVTVLISSHNLAYTTDICSRVILLEKGVIINDLANSLEAVANLNSYFVKQAVATD
ncbi:ABC-2 type transport system ATP-binding protein [Parabacteroides sp. PF5-5]|uniref:ABC transporter ATP-binding protein n=1 Tax=unclassified Parabacteroides TaxID=2649774 RepID=UPI0024761A18|nr:MULTISPECIES: ABC transporter ATP-binding protein [unclassified Parabacteroides]MDH6305911.1 ABC-2 type transport system ATP-binding protein [Parabacteroides sp. PH5-39]MDH6316874.1 ABC-2 type transport system ATP-binding protein [Parabacteroides sp. PF5-13]MDH6320623.1 ABC-2 type transport system ATP-binding protein [Parabacteroides sp. PH5-13]MDH6324456.1 ABC-2 type transport system ATP-binding protein [Parabacteroides sp. PH5-8]MDH6328059.1 ABC-2 type transport system ATP-binding protein